jgi:hypothetical protein
MNIKKMAYLSAVRRALLLPSRRPFFRFFWTGILIQHYCSAGRHSQEAQKRSSSEDTEDWLFRIGGKKLGFDFLKTAKTRQDPTFREH